MSQKHLLFSLFSCTLSTLSLNADTNSLKSVDDCGKSPYHMSAEVRHIEGEGIGYQDGYTTLDFFLSPDVERFKTTTFLDLRGHVFDDGKFASNVGIGVRHRASSRIWGANAYYDYRQAPHRNYSQFGLGFESLGTVWDFRVNGYLPVGKKQSHWYGLEYDKFKDHYMYLESKQRFAMKGLDMEAGAHYSKVKDFDFYAAAGPYYFEGQGKNAWGGKARLGGRWKQYFFFEFSGSYDTVFHDIAQVQVGFSLPFGPRSRVKSTSKNCSNLNLLLQRMVQPVARQEIIVSDKRTKKEKAIDPATGKPYFFIFVNNQSHSQGTYESPYNDLLTALSASKQNDIIYIYPGDGTTTGLNAFDNAFQLKDNQQLLGAGYGYTFQTMQGAIEVPALASGLPNLTANMFISVVTVANNNTVSGLNVSAVGDPYCVGSDTGTTTNLKLTNNVLNVDKGADGVFINNIAGTLTASNNSIVLTNPDNDATGIYVFVTDSNATVNIQNNSIMGGITDGSGIEVEVRGNSNVYATIKNNAISDCTFGINLTATQTFPIVNVLMENNVLSNSSGQGINILASEGATVQADVLSNNFINNTLGAQFITTNQAPNPTLCLQFLNNTSASDTYLFSNVNGTFYAQSPDSALSGIQANNTGTINTMGIINYVPVGGCSGQ